MTNKLATWQKRFELTTCAAVDVEKSIPDNEIGIAVVYTQAAKGAEDVIHLVVESRSSSLRSQTLKRLQTAKLPALESLTVSFKTEALKDTTAETLHAACRKQVIRAAEMRRELRPAMR